MKRTVLGMIRSLTAQIIGPRETLPKEITELYKQGEQSHHSPLSSISTLLKILKGCLDYPGQKYLMIEALDECDEQEDLLEVLKDLANVKNGNLHIFVTARPTTDIMDELRPIATQCVSLGDSKTDQDIARYVHYQVFSHPKLKGWPQEVKEEIERKLGEKAQGMYVTSVGTKHSFTTLVL